MSASTGIGAFKIDVLEASPPLISASPDAASCASSASLKTTKCSLSSPNGKVHIPASSKDFTNRQHELRFVLDASLKMIFAPARSRTTSFSGLRPSLADSF